MIRIQRKQNGMAALIIVIVIGAVMLIMGKSLAFIGLSHSETALAFSQGNMARETAVSCAEEVLRRFQINEDYSASNKNISIGSGQCAYSTGADGNSRTLQLKAWYNDYFRQGRVELNIDSGIITINLWQI